MNEMNPKADWFFQKESKWKTEYAALRSLVLECGINEEIKWGVPCYTYSKANIVLIHGFKEYFALLFHKGVLLKNKENLLIQQTENVQSARQIRFKNLEDIIKNRDLLKAYVFEAIEVEKAGLKVTFKKTAEGDIPIEFQQALEQNKDLEIAFNALTPGRQRAYLFHFSQAKQTKTRQTRIDKYTNTILNGKGIDD